MSNLQVIEQDKNTLQQNLAATDVREHVNLIQRVMKSVMKNGTHYGTIPGCGNKPTLYKAGAEVLFTTFRIGLEIDVEDLSKDEEIRYRVKAKCFHQTSGTFLGEGVGECSTGEEKYKWRNAVCDEEFEDTPETRRRIKYGKKKGGGYYKSKQVRTEPSDVANTVLKMAKKRAQVDAALTISSASDIFTQDIEDIPPEFLNNKNDEPVDVDSIVSELNGSRSLLELRDKFVGIYRAYSNNAEIMKAANKKKDEVKQNIVDIHVDKLQKADSLESLETAYKTASADCKAAKDNNSLEQVDLVYNDKRQAFEFFGDEQGDAA